MPEFGYMDYFFVYSDAALLRNSPESTVASCRPYARMSGIFEKGCALSFSAK